MFWWWNGGERGAGPAVLVVTGDESLEDAEHLLGVGGGAEDDGVGAVAESVVEFAHALARGSVARDDDGRRGRFEPAEDFEEALAAFGRSRFDLLARGAGVEREAEVDDGGVDGRRAQDLGGLGA